MYKVIEVAKKLNTSKVTIYKKIELLKKELRPYLHKKQNITYIDEEGIEIIKKSLSSSAKLSNTEKEIYETEITELKKSIFLSDEKLKNSICNINQLVDKTIIDTKSYIRTLENQIKVKEKELHYKETLLKEFKNLIKANKNRIKYLEDMLK
ncbi:hypothetical protein [Helicovermis profundi]|uniref:Helix-turn-helix type 11 domain-containing protein n=1 Tax=Helicovermis profundi TaxID=3065157 RepID=A0AAU9ESQ3_9FIRM|nr:hypothetical protein HLPR_27720 [Clostridia bacterium S502]